MRYLLLPASAASQPRIRDQSTEELFHTCGLLALVFLIAQVKLVYPRDEDRLDRAGQFFDDLYQAFARAR
jgi:hypothetical protein